MRSFANVPRFMSIVPIGILFLITAALSSSSQGASSDPATAGVAPLYWGTCREQQIQVMILGTFHFDQTKAINILDAGRQAELDGILTELAKFTPDLVAVEYPWAEQKQLDDSYETFMKSPDPSTLRSKNEVFQLGFRLARRLNLPSVAAIDVPMNLWDEKIRDFDE